MGRDTKETELSLQNLRGKETSNKRPYNPANEGRTAYSEQYPSGLSELQRTKGQSHKNLQEKGQPLQTMHVNRATGIKFGGNKYGDSNDPKFATKSGNEYIDTGTRNKRSVWTITTKPFKEAHFATFPEDLIVPMVLAGCPKGGVVLDCFMGAGTTAVVAKKLDRNYIGIELNPKYVEMAEKRINAIPQKLF